MAATVTAATFVGELLAEGGGELFVPWRILCVFIPNNTAQDGSVARALEGLRTLSTQIQMIMA